MTTITSSAKPGFLVHNENCWCGPGQELHHIVPENMPGFEPALGVLRRAGIDVNDLENLMPIDYFLHRRIHTGCLQRLGEQYA